MKKRIAMLMAIVLVVQMLPLPKGVLPELLETTSRSEAAAMSGTDGGISWNLTAETKKDGWMLNDQQPYKLTISGSGAMKAYSTEVYKEGSNTLMRGDTPWKEYAAQIQTISIGNGITEVSSNAFYGCINALSAELPESVVKIGASAFRNSYALTKIALPGKLTSIGSYAFYGCTDMVSFTIPSSVTTIGTCAFTNCSKLTQITVPGSVKEIQSSTFYNCRNVTKVVLGEGITSIGTDAFANCGALANLSLPQKSLTTLGDGCFSNTALTSFSVPASVTTIRSNPCVGGALQTVSVASGNPNYAVDNNMLLEMKDSKPYKVVCYPCYGGAGAVVPRHVEIIGINAFMGAKVKTVDLPGSLLKIENNAFYYDNELKEITVPGNVTEIGYRAFFNCTALRDVTLGDGLLTIMPEVFYNCSAIAMLTLPDKIVSIGNSAFGRCLALKEMDFPNSIESIGSSVLEGCTSLQKVTFGTKIKTFSGNVFNACPKLAEITISPSNPYMIVEDNVVYNIDKTKLIYYAAALPDEKFMIPQSVTAVGECAFTYCSKLEELRIPETVLSLGTCAIYHNIGLGKLLFYGDAPKVVEDTSYIKRVNDITYYNVLNGSVRENKVTGDYDNTGMIIFHTAESTGWKGGWTETEKYVDKKDTHTWVHKYTFSNWDPAKTDVANGSFGTLEWTYRDDIGELKFSGEGKIPDFTADALPTWNVEDGDSHMQDIKLLDIGSVSEIGNYAFFGAEKLIRVLSGDKLKRIGESAFADCAALKIVYVPSAEAIEKKAFCGDTAIVDELDVRGAKNIGDGAFRACTAMTDILLGESLKTIDKEAFAGCKKLQGLILPESLTTLGDGCFRECQTLRTINMPKGITAVPEHCFADCRGLQKVYFYGDFPDTMADTAFDATHTDITLYYRKGNTTWNAAGSVWNGISVVGQDKFYTGKKDNYSFANSASSFGYGSRYFIPRQRYVTAVQSIVRGSYYYAWADKWKGSCFGMAASTTEFYEGEQFAVTDYSTTAKNLYDVPAPRNSNADLTKLIEIYQVSQFADEIGWETAENYQQYRKLIKQVEEFERSGGLGIDSTADPVILCVYAGCSGHALVPVAVNMDAQGNYILDVYDCNYPAGFQKLTVKKDFSGIIYEDYCTASFVKYSTIRDALEQADFTGNSLSSSARESSKVSIAVNREDVNLTNSGGRDFKEIKGAYEQRAMSDGEQESDTIRSFVLPQGEYEIQEKSQTDSEQEELKYYVATEDLFSQIETSDEDAKLTVKSVKGVGEDIVTLSSDNADTESEITVMDVSGIEKEISVTGSGFSIEMLDDSEMTLSVSEDTSSVKVDGEDVTLSGDQANLSFYVSGEDNPMEISDMTCEFSMDESDKLSGVAEAYVTWKKEEAQDVDVTTKIKDEDGNVIAEYEKKMNLTLGMQKVNVTLDGVKTNASHLSGEFDAVCEMTLVDKEDNIARVTCSDISLTASEKDITSNPTPTSAVTPTPTPSASATPEPTETATAGPTGTVAPTSAATGVPTVTPTQTPAANRESSLPKVGKVKTVGDLKYIVQKSSKKNGTVAVYGVSAKKKTAKRITIPKKVKIGAYSFKVVGIHKNAFSGMKKLSSVTIGANVTSIGNNAFKNCKKLEFVIIPGKVTTIGKQAFAGCSRLHSILVKSNKIKSVGAGAFRGTASNVRVKTSKAKWRTYSVQFIHKGKMSTKCTFIVEPVKLKYRGKSY